MTINKIEELIKARGQATAKELRDTLGVSQVLVHRHLKTLCEKEAIKKIGSPPKVIYIPETKIKETSNNISSTIIEENWLEISPNGDFVYGMSGFIQWCKQRSVSIEKHVKIYEEMFRKKESLKDKGLIDATNKIVTSFDENFLDKLWYIDFYSWEIFGKTLLGKLILYAKQNSDVTLMKKISQKIEEPLTKLVKNEGFDMIIPVPHSVPRKVDFLQTTLGFLNLTPVPVRAFLKVFSGHAVAQKTLKSKEDRQRNAEETIFLNHKQFPKKVLLIDDACGSGSTLNIAARKIKKVAPRTQVYGLTFVGSVKGFEVIAES